MGRPGIHRVEHGAEQHGGANDIGELLAHAARRGLREWVGKMLRARPEIDAHGLRLDQVIALGIRMHERAASLPVTAGNLALGDDLSVVLLAPYFATDRTADAIAKQTEGKLVSAFVRARKPK